MRRNFFGSYPGRDRRFEASAADPQRQAPRVSRQPRRRDRSIASTSDRELPHVPPSPYYAHLHHGRQPPFPLSQARMDEQRQYTYLWRLHRGSSGRHHQALPVVVPVVLTRTAVRPRILHPNRHRSMV
jgi:hypothetical protein